VLLWHFIHLSQSGIYSQNRPLTKYEGRFHFTEKAAEFNSYFALFGPTCRLVQSENILRHFGTLTRYICFKTEPQKVNLGVLASQRVL